MSKAVEIIHGPPFIGNIFNILLFGIMIAQTYIYFTTYKDPKWIRFLVLAVLLVDIVNVVFNCSYLYTALIVHFDDTSSLAEANWYASADPATTGILGSMVQLFFAWRIHVLTRNWFLVATVVGLAVTGLVGSLVSTYKLIIIPEFARLHEFKGYITLWLASASAADIIITIILVWYLVRSWTVGDQKHRTGFRGSNMLVDRIIRLVVPTGLITSMFAIISLIIFLLKASEFSNSGIYLAFNIPLVKLYSNSFMSSLNSRGGWKFGPSNSWSGNEEVGSFMATPQNAQLRSQGNAARTTKALNLFKSKNPSKDTTKVLVHVESHEMRDSNRKEQPLSQDASMERQEHKRTKVNSFYIDEYRGKFHDLYNCVDALDLIVENLTIQGRNLFLAVPPQQHFAPYHFGAG
ncbi:hypothetical protein P691DRAFT_773397 [Macrolepiota fuliginosa MF-IS2]|uniref:DUF6534 domain-containing protein n=1 Tax=Macrolepiota fuliginosa MF-IS2 TaxID=1400762 RepID=A0A9P6C7A4_9AGAR|nr:hypothetical protein P691DRAFT_773397 [Macrolepiota fuliginosa MF-IS2]